MIAGILVADRYTPVEKSPVKVSNTNGSPERTFWIMKSKKKDIIMTPRMNAERKSDKY